MKKAAVKKLSSDTTSRPTAKAKKRALSAYGIPDITRKIDNRKELKNSLDGLIKQKRNTHVLLFFPLDLWIYNLAYTKKDKGLYWWIRTNVGEEPVILDSSQAFTSSILINNYLQNKGYLKPKTSFKVKIKRKKAWVTYRVKPGFLYTYDTIRYVSDNANLAPMLVAASAESFIKRNGAFDVMMLDKERERIAHFFRDKGYFRFAKNQLYFEWDTSKNTHKVNLILHLIQMSDSMAQTTYTVTDIKVYPSYNVTTDSSELRFGDTLLYHGLHILSVKYKPVVKPFVVKENIFLQTGALFSETKADNTLKKLNSIGIFKFVTVHYQFNDSGHLVASYFLTPAKRNLYQADFDLYNTIENPIGSGVKLSYKNRNLARIGLQFLFEVTTAVEITNFKYYYNETKDDYRIGVFTVSPKVSFYWPRFISLPGRKFWRKLFPQTDNPRTLITVGYNFDERIKYFTLTSLSATFGYDEEVSARTHIVWNPMYLTFNDVSHFDSTFKRTILDKNPVLSRSLEFRFIQGSTFTYLHNNQVKQDQKKYYYLRLNLDYAGNLMRLFSGLYYEHSAILGKNYWDTARSFSIDKNNGLLRFAQFTKVDGDIRQYYVIDSRNLLVLRVAAGVGASYGNSALLPYIKQFFLGGASGLRGWQVYGIGPGTYHPPPSTSILYDQTGDVKFETNAEYRFSFVGRLKGAFFSDAGNIWNLRRDPTRPEGQFSTKNLALGWDVGFGARIDFTFFIFRLDIATPLYDPTKVVDERWIYTFKPFQANWLSNHAVFNFAVGYPF